MANLTYAERVALEQEKERLRRQREDERRNGAAATRANDSRITGNDDAMHGKAGRKWLGGEEGSVSSGDALHGKAGRKWLGGGGGAPEDRGNGVSFFASDGKGRISRSTDGGQVVDTDPWGNALRQQQMSESGARYGQAFKDQKATHDEMAQVMETARRENAKRQLALANDVASAMAFSQGGVIPEPLRNLINRRHGFDGQTTGILPSSGFTSDGSFDLILGNGVDQDGNVVTSRQSFDPMSQYMMMGTNRAAFSDDDRAKMREKLSKQYGFSEKELAGIDAGFQQMALASGGGRGNGGSGVEKSATGTPSARDMNAIAGTIERIGGMSPDMFEGGASEQKAFIKHLMQQTGFQFDGSAGGGGGGGLAVQPKNGSGAATVETGDETTPAPTGVTQQGAKPVKKATDEQIAEAKAAKEKLAARKRDQDWGATTLADGYTLGDEQQSEDEEGVSFRPVLDKDGNNVGAIYSDGFRSQLGEDGQYAEVPDDADASWQDEERTTDELRRRFAENGGKEYGDGSFNIDGDEYLSDDERAELGGGSSESITRKLVRAQTQIAKRRDEVVQKRKAKEELLKLDARKKFRGNTKKQKEWVEHKLNAWDAKNDPSLRKQVDDRRFSSFVSDFD